MGHGCLLFSPGDLSDVTCYLACYFHTDVLSQVLFLPLYPATSSSSTMHVLSHGFCACTETLRSCTTFLLFTDIHVLMNGSAGGFFFFPSDGM